MFRRLLRLAAWTFAGLAAIAALLWTFRRPLLARVGISLPEGPRGRSELEVPPGFRASVFADGLQRPRFMAIGPDGTVFVADMGANQVVALPDRDGDGRADERVVVAELLDRPSSLVFHDGALYVGESGRVTRLNLDAGVRAEDRVAIVKDLPRGGQHFTRTILFGPDGRLYVSIGSSCNVCEESDPHRAAVWVYPAEGGPGQPFTVGLRNAVGLAMNPWRDSIWATNMGRDLIGDDQPPETIYELAEGRDAGWPRCHAGSLPDPEFGSGPAPCSGTLQPVVTMQAHVAPLGLAFYPREVAGRAAFDREFQGDLYVALHGSWNRSVPVGYKVARVPLDETGLPVGPAEDFASGFRRPNGQVLGRPAGLLVMPDGSMLVSDDYGGFIYRIAG